MLDLPRRRPFGEAERRQLVGAAERVFSGQPGVIAAYLYGSAARGGPARDLDVAVLFDEPFDSGILEPLASALERTGAPRGPDVDLRPLNGAAPRFQAAVLRDGQLLFERDRRARWRHEAVLLSRWADFQPVWSAMRQRMFERWARG